MGLKSFLSYPFAKYVVKKNERWKKNPSLYQRRLFSKLVSKGKKTSFGRDHGFSSIKNYTDWKKNVPIRDYEGLSKYIERVVRGEKDVLWPGFPIYFCKTSGTTSGIKHIPISKESMPHHIKGAKDAILSYIAETKNTSIVSGKMIFLQGSPELTKTGDVLTGRLSGIVAHHVPRYLLKNRLPSFRANCISDWDKKLDAIVGETISEDMTVIGGIPPWVQMYFEKLSRLSNKKIKELFKNFNLFIYGGVNYNPYRNTFKKLIGGNVDEIELYPASEGFIGYTDSQKEHGLLLCVNHGIFYEFITAESFFNDSQERISLGEVKLGVNYVIILNTDAGLWGYNIGDTVKFVCLNPYRIIVTGRIKHFTSAFGEHVIAEDVDGAMIEATKKHPAKINDFHVSPEVNPKSGLPFHEWFIEFDEQPKDFKRFSRDLDVALQNKNTYYKDLIVGKVLRPLKISIVKRNGFRKYMESEGRLGGQNKVPRLSNDRKTANKLKIFKE